MHKYLIVKEKPEAISSIMTKDEMAKKNIYGCPMKPFFIEIQNFWAWADKLRGYILVQ
jgi:hypothetical protein